ncbi:hypothetical protein [Kitasatospora cinereorecta]|uniref:Uncharacterized protein n=1 Tax=Kitasatospora cinereorecta TaxID=285560 RepID=A0ABW0VA89_9ACTN
MTHEPTARTGPEHRLAQLLGESVEHLPVPVRTMVAAAGVRGRRLRRERRLRTAGLLLTVLALASGAAIADRQGPPRTATPAVASPAARLRGVPPP